MKSLGNFCQKLREDFLAKSLTNCDKKTSSIEIHDTKNLRQMLQDKICENKRNYGIKNYFCVFSGQKLIFDTSLTFDC